MVLCTFVQFFQMLLLTSQTSLLTGALYFPPAVPLPAYNIFPLPLSPSIKILSIFFKKCLVQIPFLPWKFLTIPTVQHPFYSTHLVLTTCCPILKMCYCIRVQFIPDKTINSCGKEPLLLFLWISIL